MSSALGDQALVGKLLATQIGEASYPVQTAYINNIVPVPAATLQQVCDQGSVTDTGITVTAGNVVVNENITIDQGNLTVGVGDITVNQGGITVTAGDITVTAGDIEVTNGELTVGNGITATAGGITATAGGITATAGGITATAGGITVTADDITVTAGGVLASVGNSKLNRCEYTTDFGGTTSAAPLSVAPPSSTPLRIFTLPTGTFQLTVFLTNSQPSAQEFAFEVHNLPANILRDYQVIMNSQTYDNAGGASMGFNGIVIGEAISDPTNTTKITCVFNVALPYVAQKLKCNVRFEYNPSP